MGSEVVQLLNAYRIMRQIFQMGVGADFRVKFFFLVLGYAVSMAGSNLLFKMAATKAGSEWWLWFVAGNVAAGLIKNLADLNKDLLEIQKRKRDLDPTQTKNNSTTNIDKAVFVGSTTELVKFLKNNK